MTMGGGLGSKFPVRCRVLGHSIRAVPHIVWPLTDVDIRERGGRDPNERPDNESHPEDVWKVWRSA